jgi:dTDP-4-amino-4,6-dideoxygalactose transaminase
MHPTVPFYSFEHQHQQIRAELLKAMEDTLDSGWYILGKQLLHFEQQFSEYTNTQHTIGTGNGLDALKIALMALGIGKGDEVIVPANTFIASLLAVSEIGATPVLAEPLPDRYTLDPNQVEARITSKTKAIVPVHLYGLCCEMNELEFLSHKYNLPLVEDNAQAVGALYKNKKTGSLGKINATSFYPTKNLGALGDGGAITTNDAVLAEKVKMLRNYGSEKKYYHEYKGYNSRLDEVQAAVLGVKLRYLDQWNEDRIRIAQRYTKALSGKSPLICPVYPDDCKHIFHLYVVRTPKRQQVIEHLQQHNIQTAIHYPQPPYRQAAYADAGWKPADFPITEQLSQDCLSLPMYPGLSENDQDRVIDTLLRFDAF